MSLNLEVLLSVCLDKTFSFWGCKRYISSKWNLKKKVHSVGQSAICAICPTWAGVSWRGCADTRGCRSIRDSRFKAWQKPFLHLSMWINFRLRLKAELLVGSMLIDDEQLFFATSGAGYLRTMEITQDPTGTQLGQLGPRFRTGNAPMMKPKLNLGISWNLLVLQFDFEHQEK